jgi:hypothetical protein
MYISTAIKNLNLGINVANMGAGRSGDKLDICSTSKFFKNMELRERYKYARHQ